MAFFDHLAPTERATLESAAETLRLTRGEHLMRRGDPGGDVFYLTEGRLEVVDSRPTPEVILATLTAGTVVGEMAFIDESPRSADVRAASDVTVLQWARADLHALLDRHPVLAASFYRTVARLAAHRIRNLTQTAIVGGLQRPASGNRAGGTRVEEDVAMVVDPVKTGLVTIETALRADPTDETAMEHLTALLDRLQTGVHEVFTAHTHPEDAEEAARLLGRELHPYLVRSSLAERCIRRPQGVTGTAEILAHVLVDTAGGDGHLGELLDRWLLDRPTMRAQRAFRDPIVRLATAHLTEGRSSVLLVHAGTGSLVAGLMRALKDLPVTLTVVDQSRDALAFLDSGIAGNSSVTLRTSNESLAQLAMGRRRHDYAPQDVVILYGLLEYLPDRIAISALQTATSLLAPGGIIVATALGDTPDAALLDRVLRWPTVRRSRDALQRVLDGAGVAASLWPDLPPPATVIRARPIAPHVPAGARPRSLAAGEGAQ